MLYAMYHVLMKQVETSIELAKLQAANERKKRELEEEIRDRLRMEQLANLKEKKKSEKNTGTHGSKQKKKTKGLPMTTVNYGDQLGQNVVKRVTLDLKMKQQNEALKKKKEAVDKTGKIWPFEYTGGTKPVGDNIWDVDEPGTTSGAEVVGTKV